MSLVRVFLGLQHQNLKILRCSLVPQHKQWQISLKTWRIYLLHCKLLSKKSNMLFLRFQTPLRMPIQQLCSRCKNRLLMPQEQSVMPSQRSKKSCQESLNHHKSKAIKWLANLLMLQKRWGHSLQVLSLPFLTRYSNLSRVSQMTSTASKQTLLLSRKIQPLKQRSCLRISM